MIYTITHPAAQYNSAFTIPIIQVVETFAEAFSAAQSGYRVLYAGDGPARNIGFVGKLWLK
jgi:hypothetical protein